MTAPDERHFRLQIAGLVARRRMHAAWLIRSWHDRYDNIHRHGAASEAHAVHPILSAIALFDAIRQRDICLGFKHLHDAGRCVRSEKALQIFCALLRNTFAPPKQLVLVRGEGTFAVVRMRDDR